MLMQAMVDREAATSSFAASKPSRAAGAGAEAAVGRGQIGVRKMTPATGEGSADPGLVCTSEASDLRRSSVLT